MRKGQYYIYDYGRSMSKAGDLGCAAHELARRGYFVFPLRPYTNQPAHNEWELLASEYPESVLKQWGKSREASESNIGIACGPSRLIVIDVPGPDISTGSQWDELVATLGPLPETRTVEAGRFTHYYFRAPDGVNVETMHEFAQGVNVYAWGGYVVAPPSIFRPAMPEPVMHSYVVDMPPTELPEAWLDAIQSGRSPLTPKLGAV